MNNISYDICVHLNIIFHRKYQIKTFQFVLYAMLHTGVELSDCTTGTVSSTIF